MDIKEQSYYNLKKIKQFLIDNKAYYNYLYNLYHQNRFNNFDDVLYFFSRNINRIDRFIDFSLEWHNTKEGVDYWRNLYLTVINNPIFKK